MSTAQARVKAKGDGTDLPHDAYRRDGLVMIRCRDEMKV